MEDTAETEPKISSRFEGAACRPDPVVEAADSASAAVSRSRVIASEMLLEPAEEGSVVGWPEASDSRVCVCADLSFSLLRQYDDEAKVRPREVEGCESVARVRTAGVHVLASPRNMVEAILIMFAYSAESVAVVCELKECRMEKSSALRIESNGLTRCVRVKCVNDECII